jgi:hypothetical protein
MITTTNDDNHNAAIDILADAQEHCIYYELTTALDVCAALVVLTHNTWSVRNAPLGWSVYPRFKEGH